MLLAVTGLLRLVTLDVIGAMLSWLMLCMALMMTADGMQEMFKYTMTFGSLCALCCFFDAIPVLASLNGRSEMTVTPVNTTWEGDSTQVTYKTTVRTTPFFDESQGVLYNLTSVSMLLSPLVMLLGAMLSFNAQAYLDQSLPDMLDQPAPWLNAAPGTGPQTAAGLGDQSSDGVARFQGTAHRLTTD